MKDIFIARQPIIDAYGHIHGYELLFRHSFDNRANPITCNTQATSRVLVNALNNFGTQKLLGNHCGFINVDHTFFDTPLSNAIPAEKFVLEILENTEIDDTVIARIIQLKERGFRFALDDMDLSDEMFCRFEPIFPHLSYVKIDLFTATKEQIQERIGAFDRYNGIKLLAEKVETVEEYEHFKNLGFDFFQGYFFEKPTVMIQKKVDPAYHVLMEVIALIDGEAELRLLEAKLLNCPNMIMNLLKYINSVSLGFKERVTSLRHAMSLLGRRSLKQWILLFLYAEATGPRFAEPVLMSVLFRAKMMNCLAARLNVAIQEEAFLTGLLSLFDVMMGATMQEVLDGVNLDRRILSALISREGELGEMLSLVIAVDEDNFTRVGEYLKKLKADEDLLNEVATESYNWANDFFAEHLVGHLV